MAIREMLINLWSRFRHRTVGQSNRFQRRDGSQRWVEADVTVASRRNIVADPTVETVKSVVFSLCSNSCRNVATQAVEKLRWVRHSRLRVYLKASAFPFDSGSYGAAQV